MRPNLIDEDPLTQIVNFCKRLQQKKFENIIVNIVISSLNVMELPEIFDFCLSNKLKYIQLSSIFTTSKRLLTNDLDYLLYYEELLTTYQKQGIIFRTAPFVIHGLWLFKKVTITDPLYIVQHKKQSLR